MRFPWGRRREREAPPISLDPLSDIEEFLREGQLVPLTEQVRIDRGELRRLIAAARALSESRTNAGLFDELDALAARARPVPLTDQHRLDRSLAEGLIEEIRETG